MSFVVVAKFPCKPGQVEAMGDLFRAALSDTREFAGCERIDVVLGRFDLSVEIAQVAGFSISADELKNAQYELSDELLEGINGEVGQGGCVKAELCFLIGLYCALAICTLGVVAYPGNSSRRMLFCFLRSHP